LTAARKDASHVRFTGGPRIAAPTARSVSSWLVQVGREVRARCMALHVRCKYNARSTALCAKVAEGPS
jgi:hypothetical protein